MSRTTSVSIAAFAMALFLIPARLPAGGPARLCLPIDGVSESNAATCSRLIADGLGDKLFPQESFREVVLEQHKNQWYALFYLGGEQDVKLSEVDAALEDSEFSVPRDRLRFFGPVRMEVDVRKADHKALLKDIAEQKHVQIEDSQDKDGTLLVTLTLPENGRRDIFRLLSAPARNPNGSTSSITARELPSYTGLQKVVAKHDATLRDISWSSQWHCRMLGTLAVPLEDGKHGKVATTR